MSLCFRHNQFGAVNIFDSQNVIVKNCTFDNNTSDGDHVIFRRFRRTGGSLSISYITKVMPVSNISIVVTDCRFNNNIATSSNGYFAPNSLHKFLSRRPSSLGSQGGGLAIVVSTRSIVNCVVNNSVFVNNTSDFIGGGLFCMTKRAHSHQTYTLENLMFINNHAVFAGALFHRSNNHTDKAFVKTTILNCIFMENIATVAGAVVIMSSFHQIINNSVEFNGCTFTKNSATDYAGTVDIVSYNIFVDRSRYTPIAFTDW